MPKIRKGVTAVIFDRAHSPYFLILKRKKEWIGWEFVKGAINENESEEDAVTREIREETNLQKFKIIKRLNDIIKEFSTKDGTLHTHSIYMVEASMNIPIHIPKTEEAEHSTYLWATIESAESKLTWDNDREILKRVIEEIKTS